MSKVVVSREIDVRSLLDSTTFKKMKAVFCEALRVPLSRCYMRYNPDNELLMLAELYELDESTKILMGERYGVFNIVYLSKQTGEIHFHDTAEEICFLMLEALRQYRFKIRCEKIDRLL